MSDKCTHLNLIVEQNQQRLECKECIKLGDSWMHLRVCLTCGHVGCCDSSKNKHASKHFDETKHPIMKSLEKDENWGWCFVDEVIFDDIEKEKRENV